MSEFGEQLDLPTGSATTKCIHTGDIYHLEVNSVLKASITKMRPKI